MEREFEIAGKKFKLSKVDAMKQFHIVRRIGPLLAELAPAMGKIGKVSENLSEEQKLEEFGKLAAPIMQGLSKLSDADADFVLYRLLACVEVHQPQFNSWAKVAGESGIVMQDLDLPVLLQLAGKALMFNLSGFFTSLPRT